MKTSMNIIEIIVTKSVRNKENNQNISVLHQTDPNSPYIFTRQRTCEEIAFAPSLKKRGTLDPAYNLALGENTRSSNSIFCPVW